MNKYTLIRKKPIFLFTFEIVISIYSVNINQISTNTSNYTICSAPNVYIFVDILIETRIAPLMAFAIPKCSDDLHLQTNQQKVNTNPKAYLVNMQVSFRYRHLPDLYRTCRIPFAHTSLVLFHHLHTSTGTIPANTFVDQYRFTIGIVVPAIYRQISYHHP